MNAKSYAYYLLSKKDYFEEELKLKLLKKGFREEEVEQVISDLREQGMLNDEKLIHRYKEKSIQKGESRAKLNRKLYLKGNIKAELSFQEELESALNLLKKSFKKEKNFENIAKFLKNRGFSYGVIQQAIQLIIKEER